MKKKNIRRRLIITTNLKTLYKTQSRRYYLLKMNCEKKLLSQIVPHEPYEIYVREHSGVDLIDFTEWSLFFVARLNSSNKSKFFEYTEKDIDVVKTSKTFIEDIEYNISLIIPSEKTKEIGDKGISKIHVGLLAKSKNNEIIQVIKDVSIDVCSVIARED